MFDRKAFEAAIAAAWNGAKRYNDPVKSAALDYAKAHAVFSVAEEHKEAARDELLKYIGAMSIGTEHVLLADKGISVTCRINNGASRLDRRQLVTALMSSGWKKADGSTLTLPDVNALIESACTVGKPATVIKSTISSME